MPANHPLKISPSILSADFGWLGEQLAVAEAGGADEIHFDVMDGQFVPGITFGFVVLQAVRAATRLPIDVHMMVMEPARYAAEYSTISDLTMTAHVESTNDIDATLDQITASGIRPGVTLNPDTPISAITSTLGKVDRVLVMTVTPGAGGQSFMAEMLPKIEALAALRDSSYPGLEIAVDGGIKVDTAPLAARAGATTLISGSGIFGHPHGISAGIASIRAAARPTH
ncbi:MAG: ribulose-phosphate 3-epimerase [Chloroflexi bacterium]|nr:ribulose-phosphate 3-epimerase [Chloroflexota bacterium]